MKDSICNENTGKLTDSKSGQECGVMSEDGAAILCDGEMLTIEQIVLRLREGENTKKLYEFELNERMNIFAKTIESMTNGEWDKLKELKPKLHGFVRQAVNR